MADNMEQKVKPKRLPGYAGLRLPSAEEYCELIGRLADSGDRADSGADPLAEAAQCLRNVLSFIRLDPVAEDAVMPGPLTELHNALHDWEQGAEPALFKRQGSRGQPTNLAKRDYARAYVASALDVLVRHGSKAPAGAQWVAETCKVLGLQVDGKPVEAKQVMRWRRDLISTPTKADHAVQIFEQRRQRALCGLTAVDSALVILQHAARHYGRKLPR